MIRKFADVSTAHITEASARWLKSAEAYAMAGAYGWLIYVGDNKVAPAGLEQVYKYAQNNDCDYLLLDQDGPVLDSLTVYDW